MTKGELDVFYLLVVANPTPNPIKVVRVTFPRYLLFRT